MITQTATIAVERPQRYAKQLASHMGNKLQVEQIEGSWKLIFDIGEATLVSTDTNLIMTTTAENLDNLQKIQYALVKHLIKFTAKLGELEISWT